MDCFPKKTKNVTCGSSIECSVLRGLECADVDSDSQLDSKCQKPDANYWISKPENAFNFSLVVALVNQRINACTIKGWSVPMVLANVVDWT